MNGSACNGFNALRVNVSVWASPAEYKRRPCRSTTATEPACTLSTTPPRVTAESGAWDEGAGRDGAAEAGKGCGSLDINLALSLMCNTADG